MQWHVQESHLQGQLSQLFKDRDDAQKQCADLQRRHAQSQHEIRRKVLGPCFHTLMSRMCAVASGRACALSSGLHSQVRIASISPFP